jgi:6-phosphogluconolactonase (cycloisomerase 2 family)
MQSCKFSNPQKFVNIRFETNELIPRLGLINQDNGSLELKQNVSVGGKTPRHISLNRNGTLAAVSLQDSERVVIFSRDVSTGTLGQEVARLEGMGGVNAAYWRE